MSHLQCGLQKLSAAKLQKTEHVIIEITEESIQPRLMING